LSSTPQSYRISLDRKGNLIEPNEECRLYIADEDDLPEVARLTIDSFGAATVTLSNELNEFEKALIGPTVGIWNAYTDAFAFVEVLLGLRARTTKNRSETFAISPPMTRDLSVEEANDVAAQSSLIFVLARPGDDAGSVECIATVELRLQPTDAKIPFSQPWLDEIERKLAKILGLSREEHRLQPYLSNLCVSKEYRKRQLGKVLVRCVEHIARETWGYSRLYLHVDLENIPAINLYEKEGFQRVDGIRWNPFWAGKAADIGYFYKVYNKD